MKVLLIDILSIIAFFLLLVTFNIWAGIGWLFRVSYSQYLNKQEVLR